MTWVDDVRLEMTRAEEALHGGNLGKARTSARRAVGIAVTEWQRKLPDRYYGPDFVRQLRALAQDLGIPGEVRDAADRLHARVSADFTSPSMNPVEDARVIISFVLERLQ